jgi:transposase
MAKKKKQYTQEFKESAVKLITEQGYKVAEAARNLGVNANVLGRWKREVDEDSGREVNNGKELQAELVRLRKENQRLKLEREILKKAAAFFARESGCGIK